MHHVIARIAVKADAAEQMLEVLNVLARATRQEAGCVSYEVFRADAQPLFFTVERWQDHRAAEAHMATAHVAQAFASAGPLLAGAPEILPVLSCS